MASLMSKLIFFLLALKNEEKAKNINKQRKKVIKENNDSDFASKFLFYLIWMIKSKTGEFLESCK